MMSNDELRQAVIDELEKRFGSTHRYEQDPQNKPCTTMVNRPDSSIGARSLSFGEVADAAVEAFTNWGDQEPTNP